VGVVGAACGLLALLELTPSVTAAPELVQAILAAHGAASDDGIIPSKVATALLATEDSRFYGDPALDPRGVARAAWGTLTGNGNTGGATLELQLAKMLYTPGRSDPMAELEQVGVAVKLDQHFTKTQILAMYLDAAYFGDSSYGITAAAEGYFRLRPDQLSWAQASLLAGLVQAPSAYDPRYHLSLAVARQHHVLDRLLATHLLTPTQVDQIGREPLNPVVDFGG